MKSEHVIERRGIPSQERQIHDIPVGPVLKIWRLATASPLTYSQVILSLFALLSAFISSTLCYVEKSVFKRPQETPFHQNYS